MAKGKSYFAGKRLDDAVYKGHQTPCYSKSCLITLILRIWYEFSEYLIVKFVLCRNIPFIIYEDFLLVFHCYSNNRSKELGWIIDRANLITRVCFAFFPS